MSGHDLQSVMTSDGGLGRRFVCSCGESGSLVPNEDAAKVEHERHASARERIARSGRDSSSGLRGPRVVEMRYSLTHDGWFWRVDCPNPFRSTHHTIFDKVLVESGYARRRRTADRETRRAMRRMERTLAKARRELGYPSESDEPTP